MIYCKKCSKKLQDNEKLCGACAEEIEENKTDVEKDIRCIKCGNVIKKGNIICDICGQKAISEEDFKEKKEKWHIIKKVGFVYTMFYVLKKILIYESGLFAVIGLRAIFFNDNHIFSEFLNNIAIFIIISFFLIIPMFLIFLLIFILLNKKTKLSYEEYKVLKREMKGINKLFFMQIPKIK